MKIANALLVAWLLPLLTVSCTSTQTGVRPAADAVYVNAKVYTMDPEQSWAQALAIKDGKLTAVGTDAKLAALVGNETEVVDLQGKFVMPGIQDAHVHTQMIAEFTRQLSMDPHQSWSALSKAIRDYAAAHPDRRWVFGGNLPWLTTVVGEFENVPAHKSVLDELVPDRPAAFWDIGGHALLTNSLALKLAGIDRNTPNPVGGTIERDANGEATGVLRELAVNLVTEAMDQLSVDAYAQGIKTATEKLNGLGITSMNEVWVYPQTLRAIKQLDDNGDLTVRATASIAHPVEHVSQAFKQAASDLIDARETYRSRRVKPDYVKFVLDGSAGGQTLAMNDPYLGTEFRGELRNPEDVVMREVSRLHAKGIGSVLHAVGDRAVRVALNAVEQAIATHGDNGVRHVIGHTVFVNPEDLDRFAELGVIAEFSPYFWWPSDGLDILRDELGEQRTNWGFPVRELLERGVHLSAGSDWPVVFDPNPFPAIEALVTRETPGGSADSYGKDHAISLAQALHIYTLGSAYELHQEDQTGSLEPGKYADFIVLDRNLFDVPIREVHATKVLTTVLEGEMVFQQEAQ
ncbi:MAG: amidohydrolase [Pseudomonadales bacterium]